MHAERNIVARARNHFSNENTTILSVCTCHCQQYKNIKCCIKMRVWQVYVAGISKKLGLRACACKVPNIFVRF